MWYWWVGGWLSLLVCDYPAAAGGQHRAHSAAWLVVVDRGVMLPFSSAGLTRDQALATCSLL